MQLLCCFAPRISSEEGSAGVEYFYCQNCGHIMSEECALCKGPVNPYDESTWKEVSGWVGGPHKDGMCMRTDTGRFAHNHCVQKAKAGQAPDQPELIP